MALDTRSKRPPVAVTLWKATIGKKIIMALTGLIMIGYLVLHMAGNLKIFSGAKKFNDYSHWLRTFGEPVLPYEGFLWILRVVLLGSVIAHIAAAVALTHRSHQPHRASKKKVLGRNYVTFTMRSGGVILALFVVWHVLDLTTLTVNTRAQAGHPYENLVASFSTWYGNVIYLVAVTAVGFHLWFGTWHAAQTLGVSDAARMRLIRQVAAILATVIAVGFALAPISVMAGVVQ
ncbi:succinate dehydrogenase cytochrome b subunit [Stackebrandtia nassauensis]|uniref:Succinate dehydrogenase (Or fumarate reductase) cytochrome b subunit, b558 family n=1 Tax=Stackebrandtia nassauensis (strain DSM 44728 / CIP 108903 / NRRL B-16338 / NBRC 102104 / LLR-40K-21) TaxID=446470 RepID=D3QBX1_STANL|nr:succinate dehydrogenase cytochrome b subunit [Stackebrandtia nassauensis]ADD44860.1 succinate dehydrogenase (or fumarate reductase) cytochrome b subunit, b558 family [Stackebrandtia nassauensis DSM 44728]